MDNFISDGSGILTFVELAFCAVSAIFREDRGTRIWHFFDLAHVASWSYSTESILFLSIDLTANTRYTIFSWLPKAIKRPQI